MLWFQAIFKKPRYFSAKPRKLLFKTHLKYRKNRIIYILITMTSLKFIIYTHLNPLCCQLKLNYRTNVSKCNKKRNGNSFTAATNHKRRKNKCEQKDSWSWLSQSLFSVYVNSLEKGLEISLSLNVFGSSYSHFHAFERCC